MSKRLTLLGLASVVALTGAALITTSCTGQIDTGSYSGFRGSGATTGFGANGTPADTSAVSSCSPEQTDCNDVCVDLQSDGANCGECGVVCATGQVCSNGACSTTCGDLALTVCGQGCADLASNPNNCGSCGNSCGAGQSCVRGSCECGVGLTLCGMTCVNLTSDSFNCGGCGTTCSTGTSCLQGTCTETTVTTSENSTSTSTTGSAADTGTTGGVSTTGGFGNSTTGGFGSTTSGNTTGDSTTGDSTTGDSTTGGGAGAVTFADVAQIIATTCAVPACHGGRERPSLLNDAALYNTLMNTTVRQCGGSPLVTANNAGSSSLLLLVNRQCGNFVMPEGCQTTPCISADDIATITAWIEAGAPNN